MTVSFLVALTGAPAPAERALAALDRAIAALPEAEVLVLGRGGALAEALAARVRGAVAVPAPAAIGAAVAAGVRRARGDVVVIVSDRALADAAAVTAVLDAVAAPGVAAAAAAVGLPGGRLRGAGVAFRAEPGRVMPFEPFAGEPIAAAPHAAARVDVDAAPGVLLAVRRDALVAAGGVDEGYEDGLHDLDLCLRLRLAGDRVVVCGDTPVVHQEGVRQPAPAPTAADAARFTARFGAALDDDAGTLAALYGAAFDGGARAAAEAAPMAVEGLVLGLAPEASEARSLVAALAALGLSPAARDHYRPALVAQPDPAEAAALAAARARVPAPGAPAVVVPPPGAAAPAVGRPTVLRPSGPVPACAARAAWAPTRPVADALVRAGVAPGRVEVLPPLVDVASVPGGDGVVAVLPAHDPALAGVALAALAALPADVPVTLVPTVAATAFLATLRDALPAARVLDRAPTAAGLAALAARAAVLVALDRRDGFGRVALAAAAAGAAVVTRPDGVAAAAAPDAVVAPERLDADAVATAVRAALAAAPDRAGRSGAVAAACGPDTVLPRLRELVADAVRPAPRPAAAPPSVTLFYPELPDGRIASGHRRAGEMTRALARLGYETTLVTLESRGQEDAIAALEADGVTVLAADQPGSDLDAAWANAGDVAILAYYDMAERIMPLIRRRSPATRIVVDSVDIVFRRLLRAADTAGDPAARAEAEAVRARELAVYAAADCVLAVSDEEQEILLGLLPGVPVGVVPNVHRVGPATGPDGRSGALFVGSYRHVPNVDAAAVLLGELLPHARALGFAGPVRLAGSSMPPELAAAAAAAGAEALGHVPSLDALLAASRVSLAPLRFGAGMKGKVGEALAAGLPVVGTPVAAEGFDRPERGMLVAERADDMAAALVRLAHDDDLWQRLSDGGRALVSETLGPDRCERELRAVVEHLVPARKRAA